MVGVFYEFYALHSDHIHTIILWRIFFVELSSTPSSEKSVKTTHFHQKPTHAI